MSSLNLISEVQAYSQTENQKYKYYMKKTVWVCECVSVWVCECVSVWVCVYVYVCVRVCYAKTEIET